MSSNKLCPQSLFEITNLRAISSQGEIFSSKLWTIDSAGHVTAGAVIHLDDQTLHLGHTLSSDPPKGPPWATAGLLLPSLLKVKLLDLVGSLWARANLHPVFGRVHALAPLKAVQYPLKNHTRLHFSSIVHCIPNPPALNWSFSLGTRALKILKFRRFDDWF